MNYSVELGDDFKERSRQYKEEFGDELTGLILRKIHRELSAKSVRDLPAKAIKYPVRCKIWFFNILDTAYGDLRFHVYFDDVTVNGTRLLGDMGYYELKSIETS